MTTINKIRAPVTSSSVGSDKMAGVGEQSTSTVESSHNTEVDGASVNSKTFGIDSHLGKIQFTESDTGATIEIENAKASFRISKSGHLDVISTSGSGITLTATSGKVVINAVDMVIKSSGSMSIDSGGDLNLNAKGGINFTTPTGAITMTAQAMDQKINGTYSMTITKELNQLIGGHMRSTVAGDHRSQVSGFSYYDTGADMRFRSTGEMILNTSDSFNLFSGEDSTINTKGKLNVTSTGDMALDTSGTMNISSTGSSKVSSEGEMTLATGSDLSLSASGTTGINSGSSINIDGSTIDLQNGGSSSKSTNAVKTSQAPEKSQVVESVMVQDEISTNRKAPGYAYNGKGRTNSGSGRLRNKGASSSGHGENPNADVNGVDSRLVDITNCATKKFEAATGYRVGVVSGYRPGDSRFHGQGKAMDFAIYDQNGKMFGNYQDSVTSEGFRAYEAYAQQAKACQEQLHPNTPLRWGGYFWNGGRGNYGAMDPMHLDIGGVSTAGGNWGSGASSAQLNEWGLNSSATKGYNGQPDYTGVGNASNSNGSSVVGNDGVENGSGTGDQYKKFVNTEADKESKKNVSSDPKKITKD